MSADLMREAAALMRERAEAATPGPWVAHVRSVTPEASHPHVGWISTSQNRTTVVENAWDGDVLHLASWHPAVALAVADLFELLAYYAESMDEHDPVPVIQPVLDQSFAVARAYLGRDA